MNGPEFVDVLELHLLLPFEVDGWKYPVPDVLANRIVNHLDVVEHVLPCLLLYLLDRAPHPLALGEIEEAAPRHCRGSCRDDSLSAQDCGASGMLPGP